MEHRRERNDNRWKSVPEFGSWDKKGSTSPNYSVVFSQARANRKQIKNGENINLGTKPEVNVDRRQIENDDVSDYDSKVISPFENNKVHNNNRHQHNHHHHQHQNRYYEHQGHEQHHHQSHQPRQNHRHKQRQRSQKKIHHIDNDQDDDSYSKKRSFMSYFSCCMRPKM